MRSRRDSAASNCSSCRTVMTQSTSLNNTTTSLLNATTTSSASSVTSGSSLDDVCCCCCWSCAVKIQRLKNEKPERFASIVMMHLSIIMDLSDSGLEELMEEAEPDSHQKQRTAQWARSFFLTKRKTASEEKMANAKIFGTRLNVDSITKIQPIIAHLSQIENLQREGLFRLSGNTERQRELRDRLDKCDHLEVGFSTKYTANDQASVLKSFLAELPEPLMLEKNFHAYLQIAGMKDLNRQIQCLQLLNQLLPIENACLLQRLIELLNSVSTEPLSRMTADNLSILFTPHLFIPRKTPASLLQEISEKLQSLMTILITHHNLMFEYPIRWVADVVRHWHDLEVKSIGSAKKATPNQPSRRKNHRNVPNNTNNNNNDPADIDEDEDDDDVIVQTTFTFTDRKASKAAAEASSTDAALSQLYAHVCQLPESARKRKLLKEMGRGMETPVQSAERENKKNIGSSLRRFISKRPRLNQTSESGRNTPAPLTPLQPSNTPLNTKNPVTPQVKDNWKKQLLFKTPSNYRYRPCHFAAGIFDDADASAYLSAEEYTDESSTDETDVPASPSNVRHASPSNGRHASPRNASLDDAAVVEESEWSDDDEDDKENRSPPYPGNSKTGVFSNAGKTGDGNFPDFQDANLAYMLEREKSISFVKTKGYISPLQFKPMPCGSP